MPHEDSEASEVYKAEEVVGLVLVSRADSPEAQEPSEEPFDLPAPSVAAQAAPVGLAPCVDPSRGDQLDSFRREVFFESSATIFSNRKSWKKRLEYCPLLIGQVHRELRSQPRSAVDLMTFRSDFAVLPVAHL
jgi:hypothetical protein